MLRIIPIPALKDNYIWAVVNEQLKQLFVVDPGEAAPLFAFLEQRALKLVAVFLTHKHADHSGAVPALLSKYRELAVYAHPLERVSLTTHYIQDNETISLDKWSETFKVLHIPGHTLGHLAYYGNSLLFSGDTLFAAGCGRIFEGSAEQMFASLNRLAALPDETLLYCGHEYTLANLDFALHVEPKNEEVLKRIKDTEKLLLAQAVSLPSTIGLEKQTNPFLRCRQASLVSAVERYTKQKLETTLEVFRELREWKNNY